RDFIDTPVKRYSSGMYVKLAFAVAAHLDSEIMIMDEVLAVGDTKFQKKCINKMKSVANDDGRTVLYVSHNMSTIRQLCSRCIVLKEGKVIYDGEVEKAIQIYSEESFDFGLKNIFDEANIIDKNSLVYIKSVEFLDEKDLFFNANEKIKIKVGYKSKIEKANMAVCCIIKYMGTSPVGTCVSNDFKVNETDEGYFTFELSLDGFIAGQYTCDLEIGEIETETFRAKGVQVRAFGFNIAKNKNYRYLDWNTNNWGLSVLPKLEVNAE
ncbi:MAG: ABC transporter ATP-binding protein, partial [Oscillospiraceae bacterium]